MCSRPLNEDEGGVGITLTTSHHYALNILYPRGGYREMGVIVIYEIDFE